jgi:hypothetical protein
MRRSFRWGSPSSDGDVREQSNEAWAECDLLFRELRLLHRSHPLIRDRGRGTFLYCRLPSFSGETSLTDNPPIVTPLCYNRTNSFEEDMCPDRPAS